MNSKSILVLKRFRVFFTFILCKLLIWSDNAIATTFSAPSTTITLDQPSGRWIEVKKFLLFNAPPNYDGIRGFCSGLGVDGNGYAACATGEIVHTPNFGGAIDGSFTKNTAKLTGPNNTSMEVGLAFSNMGIYFAGQKYNSGHADARATIIPLASAFTDPSTNTTTAQSIGWEGAWSLKVNNGCNIFSPCTTTKGIAALLPYNSKYGTQAIGGISLYIRVPNVINPGRYSGTVSLGRVSINMDMGSGGTRVYHANINAYFDVIVPQRCKITLPSSVSFNTINGGNQSVPRIQTKSITFTSECSGLAETSVKAELFLESNAFDTTIGAVMLDSEKSLGVKASLNPTIDCSSKSNELFNKKFLLVEHPKSIGTSIQKKEIYLALCKFGLITKPGDYSRTINAQVIYSTQ